MAWPDTIQMDRVDVAADAVGRPVDLQSTTSKAQLDIIGLASLFSNKNELYTSKKSHDKYL